MNTCHLREDVETTMHAKPKFLVKPFLMALAAMNWLFPYSASTTTVPDPEACTAESTKPSEPDRPSSPALSAGGDQETDSASSPSAASSSSSSSSTSHFSFTTSAKRSPSSSPLCFGAGKLPWRSNGVAGRAHVPNKKQEEEADAAPPKGDVVGRYLRKISRRLRKARSANKQSPPPCRAAVDDTARERAEAVASAVAYCKESLRRGRSTARPASSPSLDCWLQGWQEEDTASAAAHSEPSPPAPLPRPRRAGLLMVRHAKGTQDKESSRPPWPPPIAATDVEHGKQSPHHGPDEFRGEVVTAEETVWSSLQSDQVKSEFNMRGSFDEIEFLKTFSENEEMIDRQFITIRI